MISSIFVSGAARVNIRKIIASRIRALTETQVPILPKVIVSLNWLYCPPELWGVTISNSPNSIKVKSKEACEYRLVQFLALQFYCDGINVLSQQRKNGLYLV